MKSSRTTYSFFTRALVWFGVSVKPQSSAFLSGECVVYTVCVFYLVSPLSCFQVPCHFIGDSVGPDSLPICETNFGYTMDVSAKVTDRAHFALLSWDARRGTAFGEEDKEGVETTRVCSMCLGPRTSRPSCRSTATMETSHRCECLLRPSR